MTVTFWGVRGSIPAPGPHTVRYGGNTSCVSVELDEDHTLVLDAGTGIRPLGASKPSGAHTYYVLLTHLHWDHIQGLPLFGPKNDPDVRIVLLSGLQPDWGKLVLSQLDGVRFPLLPEQLPAEISIDRSPLNDAVERFGVRIDALRVNHPGMCYGYRVHRGGRSFVYMPDNELGMPDPHNVSLDDLARFCTDTDLLIHDAQYTESELERRRGWGHSTTDEACRLAHRSEARRLLLFHHDPDRSDDALDNEVEEARAMLAGTGVDCAAAAEGTRLAI